MNQDSTTGHRFKRTLLLAIPYSDIYGDLDLKEIGALRLPLGVASLAAYLRERGLEVRLADLATFRHPLRALARLMATFRPDLVGISTTTPQVETALQIAGIVKRERPGTAVVLGGPHPSAEPLETAAHPDVDFVAAGEGEVTLLDLVQGRPLPEIRGLLYKDGGRVIQNPPRPLIEDLDQLPFPAYEDLPLRLYTFSPVPSPVTAILSGRGCPFNCAFCASHVIFHRRYRLRSVSRVVDQIESLKSCYPFIKTFLIADETFTVDARRVGAFCAEIARRRLRVKWACATRVDVVDEPLLRRMKRAGCICVEVGAESGSDEILKRMNKRTTARQIRDFCKMARRVGVTVLADFMLGHPYETPETAWETIRFAASIPADVLQIARCVPLPGTPVWDIVKEGRVARLTARDWSDFRRYSKAVITSDALPAEELDRLYALAYRKAYLRFGFVCATLRRCLRNPALVFDLLRKGAALLRFFLVTRGRT